MNRQEDHHFFTPTKSHRCYPNPVAFCLLLLLSVATVSSAQPIDKSSLYSPKTLQQERVKQEAGLWKYGILPVLKLTPDSTNEHQFQGALWAISQFMLKNDTTRQILDTLFANYHAINTDTKRAMMEVVYGLYKGKYVKEIENTFFDEQNEKVIIMMLAHLARTGYSVVARVYLTTKFNSPESLETPLMNEFIKLTGPVFREKNRVLLKDLFEHQKNISTKIIYSIQRDNRDFPGLAFIQNADGSFIKDEKGKLKTFVQLARSASNLPYFITNGSTPQGIFRIDSTDVSNNQFIGPTPNIQLRMPNEIPGDSFFIHLNQPITDDSIYLEEYDKLLPQKWRNTSMRQSYYAGKVGRTEIIAHGTTIDPTFYKGKPFYPCTPTMGCLCAKEIWDPKTGKLLQSDQVDLVNAFLSTPGADGYLFVINIDDQQKAVDASQLQLLVDGFEKPKTTVKKR
ncbi:MAG: hypothetical protein ABIX01_07845 [Chitinophagaceae bacterium]